MTALDHATAAKYHQQVRDDWTNAATVAAWRDWHPKLRAITREVTDALVRTARIEPGLQVLDLACGTGEPALTLAELVGPTGRVTATDLASGMVAVAEANARQAGLTNITCRQADVHDLPFPDAGFDRVTCRSGVMYFVDCLQALREVRRVLRPEGRAAFTTWGPLDQNSYFMTGLAPFLRRVNLPRPADEAPGPHRFATLGPLATVMTEAGFRQVEEAFQPVTLRWPGPPSELWESFYGLGVPFQPVINSLAPAEREQAVAEVLAGYERLYDGEAVVCSAQIVVASGVR